MSNLKLSSKIALAFGTVVATSVIGGAIAIYNMDAVKAQAGLLASEKMPQVAVANNIERSSLETMNEARAYGFTGGTNYLAHAKENLDKTKGYIAESKKLSTKYARLTQLKESTSRAEAKVQEYESLFEQTIAKNQAIESDRAQMDQAAQGFRKACLDVLNDQNKALEAEVQTNAPGSMVAETHKKITLVNEALDLGTTCRFLVWRSQAQRDAAGIRSVDTYFETIDKNLEALRAICHIEEHLKAIDRAKECAWQYRAGLKGLASSYAAMDEVNERRNTAGEAVLAQAKAVASEGLADTTKVAEGSVQTLRTAAMGSLIGLGVGVLISIGVAFFMNRSITRPIRHVARVLSSGAEQTVAAAGQVSGASQTLAEGASEQAASLQETSSSLEEMASMTKRNAENSRKANELAKQARAAADNGSRDMQQMNGAMEAIKNSSADIAKIIKTIDEIAFQTNILALNAAVEAARAGEAGLGFAVVADEVRNLAQRSAQAAKETASKIEGALGDTAKGVQISAQVSHNLEEIVTKVRQVDELIAEVAQASQEQSQGIEHVNIAINQVDKVTQSNAASAEESASAAEELNAQAEGMRQNVAELLRLTEGGVSASPLPQLEEKKRKPTIVQVHGPEALKEPSKSGAEDSAKKPMVKSTPKRAALGAGVGKRSELPMEGDFKDF